MREHVEMRYIPRRDLLRFARKYKTLSPTRLRQVILEERNKAVKTNSISKWFQRHPILKQLIKEEIIEKQKPMEEVQESIFQNGTFEELDSIKKWIRDLKLRKAKDGTVKNFLCCLKQVCKGEIARDQKIEDWVLKHPDRLTLEDAKEYLFHRENSQYKTRQHRLVLRNFIQSKGDARARIEISAKMDEYGKLSDLYVPKEKLCQILEYIRSSLNYEAYLICKFMFTTGTRIGATLNIKVSDINFEEHTITVYDKAMNGRGKRKWIKLIRKDLWDELNLENKEGKIFSLTEKKLNALERSAYKRIIPELNKKIPMPSHFWRHMFAQYMLRASNWNYGLVASLGGWSMEALRRYYGKPPQEVIKKFGWKHLPQILVPP